VRSSVWCFLLISLITLFGVEAAWAQQPFVVSRIEIVGNQNIPTHEILKAVGFRAGDTVDAAQVREAAQAIDDLGYFTKVTPELAVEEGEVVVRFKVVEYPKIKHITLLGVPKIDSAGKTLWAILREWFSSPKVSESKIRSILKEHEIRPGKVLNKVKLEKALEEILEEYRKKDLATVQIGQVIPGEDLTIEIQELPVLGHRFAGLITVPEEVAREMITVPVGEVGRYSQIQSSLMRLARSIYFSQVNVVPELGEGGVWLKWELTERMLLPEPAEVRAIELVGVEALPLDLLIARIGPLPAGTATNYDVLRALARVNDYYRREGYFMVNFAPQGLEDGILRVRVLEGRIAEIRIQGNHRTQEQVIRKVLKLNEGDFLTEARFTAARQALMSLGYFSDVTLEPAWVDEELVLTVTVKELTKLGSIRGSMSLAPKGGGLVGNLEYAQKNIFGTAQDLSLSLSRGLTSEGSTTWNLGYRGHAFPVYDLVGLDFYRKETPQDEGAKITLGGSATLAYPVAHYLDFTFTFTSEQAWLSPEREPLEPRTSIKLGLALDSRDNPFFPRRGNAGHIAIEKAGTFAPGVEYLSLEGELARYFPLDIATPVGEGRAAFAQRALVQIGLGLPEDYLFELGGARSVRGAQKVFTDRLCLLNTELRFELAQGFSLALFWDLGADLSGPNTIKASAGIELAVYIGGMFVRIDMAWPNDRPWTWVPAFEFEMSPMF